MFLQKQILKFFSCVRVLRVSFFLILGLISTGVLSYTRVATPAPVYAATSSNLNFQARLLTSSGNVVPDGFYNLEFKLYNTSAPDGGETPLQGGCTTNPGGVADEDCLWAESRDFPGTDDRVRTVNGYFSVNLGSVASLPTNINWDQDLWLSMRVGGSSTSPSWDAEMSPRVKLTSVPFAQAAGQLQKTSGANTGVLQFGTLANNPVITLPDATGTVCLQGSSACGFATGGGTAFLQGGNSFSGTTAGVLGTINNGDLNIITNNTTKLTVTTAGNLTFNQSSTIGVAAAGTANTLSLQGGTATTGNNNGGTVTLQGGTPAGSGNYGDLLLQTAGGKVGVGDTTPAYLLTVGNGDLFGVDSSGNLNFEGSSADTAETILGVTNPTIGDQTYLLPDAGAAGTFSICTSANNCTGLGAYINNNTSLQSSANFNIQSVADGSITMAVRARASQTADLLQFQNSAGSASLSGFNSNGRLYYTNSGFAGLIDQATLTGSQTYTLPNSTGTFCLTSGNCAGVGGTGDILNNGQNGPITIGTNDNTALTLETNNTPRLTILGAGNVGIGIAVPTSLLHLGSDAGDAASGIKFGSSGDTTLYRSGANALTTDGALTVSGLLTGNAGATIAGSTINLGSVSSSTLASTTNIGTTSDATGTQTVNIGSSAKAANILTLAAGSTGGIQLNSSIIDSNAATLALFATPTTINLGAAAATFNIGPGASTATSINLAGGSGNTGCTVDGATGNLTCSGNITGNTTGTVGYWSRSGTTLQPATAGDAITTSGSISTSGTGTITAAGLLTGQTGLTVTGADSSLSGGTINLNASSNFATNINTGTSTGAVAIGNSATSTFTLESGTGATNLFNGATAHTIQMATGAAAQSVTIGSTNTTSALTLQAGTGLLNIGNDTVNKTTTINMGADNTGADLLSIGSNNASSTITLESGSGITHLFNGATAHTIQMATGAAAQTVTIGSTNTASVLNLQGGAVGAINVGSVGSSTLTSTTNIATTSNATGTQTVNIGSSANAANILTLAAGSTGGINLNSSIVNSNAGTIALFATPTTINLGAAAATFNIGPTGSTATSINLGGSSTDTGCTVSGATGNFGCSGNINLAVTTATAGQITQSGNRLIHTFGGVTNFFIGTNAGNLTLTGTSNTGVGNQALLATTTGHSNTAVGRNSLLSNTDGFQNTSVGAFAMDANIGGSLNNALGYSALGSNTTGTNNNAIGSFSLNDNLSGDFNNAFGNNALQDSTGDINTAMGDDALRGNTTGSNNTALGGAAGYTANAGNANTTGSNNTFIGYNSGPGSATQLQAATAIGANAVVNQDHSLVLGCISGTLSCTTSTKVGIGTAAPSAALHVVGTTALEGGTINLNASSNFATNINTGTSTGAVAIGNSATSTFTLESGTGATNLFNGATAHTIQMATGAAAQSVTIGSTNTTSTLNLQGGASGAINIGSVGASTLASTTNIANTSNGTGIQTVNIGSSANASNVLTLSAGSTGGINLNSAIVNSNVGTIALFSTPTAINLGTAATTFNIGPTGTTATTINFAGGSGDTGCTITGAAGNFACSGTITAAGIINANATGKTALSIADSGAQLSGITIGGDANLYRNAANELKTDDYFYSAALIGSEIGGAAQTLMGAVGPSSESGVKLGFDGDTRLYRAAANTLRTDDAFSVQNTVATALQIQSAAAADTMLTVDTTTTNKIKVGNSTGTGTATTIFQFDGAASAPFGSGQTAYVGSIYYDTTQGKLQCYENRSGTPAWGACGSAPDNIITLTPEYSGAVLNGTGTGTMNADFCANQSGVLQVNHLTLCTTSGEARNYYKWTSPQATPQTYSIYVTYKLPSTFKSFSDANTMKLTAYKDHATNGQVTIDVFRKNVTSGALTQCGSNTTITTSTSAWNTTSVTGDETACGYSGNDYVIFKINVTAQSSANVYVENLDFTYGNN